jgi:prepilin-type N-terminal cleavage/methylation domain-containing protein
MNKGFTLLEVMASLVVMTIGAAGLFGLQGYIARSNLHAKKMTLATEVLETWVERLKADALAWTAPSAPATPAINLANTHYLQAIQNNGGAWVTAGADDGLGHSPAFDLFGNDTDPDGDLIAYCVSYRLGWVVPGESIRADVRVFWPRDNAPANFTATFPGCVGNQGSINSDGAQVGNYHLVYASTVLRWNPLP